MIHKHIKSLPHHPKRVIVISLVIAVVIGALVYFNIHKTSREAQIPDNNVATVQNVSLSFPTAGKVKTISVKVGDKVNKGDELATIDPANADGSLIQAEAAYELAKANYQKVINGATGTAVDVARAAVNTAQVNLEEITKQQQVAVDNAHRTLLNSSIAAQSVSNTTAYDAPTVTGTYTCNDEGSYNLEIYGSSGGYAVRFSGIEKGDLFLTDVPRSMGNCGLLLSFDKTKKPFPGSTFNIDIPNKSATSYSANNNAYQLALQNKDQAIAVAKATLDQANANLQSVATSARPEDISIAKAQVDNAYGALIANASYRNIVIFAPADGTITGVDVKVGQSVEPNTSAIEFQGSF